MLWGNGGIDLYGSREISTKPWRRWYLTAGLGHDYKFLTRELKLLDSLAEHNFREAVGVDLP